MDVIFLSPAYPTDMPLFVSGLAAVGARVIGVGDQDVHSLPQDCQDALAEYVQVSNWSDHDDVIRSIRGHMAGRNLDLIETLWEPLMFLAGRLRDEFGIDGMSAAQTVPFRDKGEMKKVVEAAGIRAPRSVTTTTKQGCRDAAAEIGYPIIIKPIAGAGAMDTYRIENDEELSGVLDRLDHVPEVSVEEFISGEEFTYDTVCASGAIAFENVCEYRPNPLIGKQVEWISPQVITWRDLADPRLADGVELGRKVIQAMGLQSGFTHMEWYRKEDGEVVFGEIGARSPGGRLTDLMNFACDTDLYVGWAEAVCYGTFSQPSERKYTVAQVIKRAQGEGTIRRVEGVSHMMATMGEHIVNVDLVPIGHPRRDWLQTVISDGIIVLRHRDSDVAVEMANEIANSVHLYCY